MKAHMDAQIELLRAGKPLEAFDTYFHSDGVMYSNDTLFAIGASEGHAKQAPFIEAATTINGRIEDVRIDSDLNLCTFRNLSSFTSSDGTSHQIDGLCWQRWKDNAIAQERYYDGTQMQQLIDDGVLINPALMLDRYPD